MLKRRSERRATARPEHATLQILIFQVGPEHYGLEISGVQEIERMLPITRVPEALSFVEGVINLRGAIIPVIDLARRFGLPAIVPDRQTRIVIARVGGGSVGFIVSAVSEVIPIAASAIGQRPSLTFEATACFVTGMVKVRERLVSMLSIERLLSVEEIGQLQQQSLA